MRSTFAVTLAVVLALLVRAPAAAQPMQEFRGLYVDAFHPGLTNHEEVTQMVKAAKEANFNALFVQVRKRGDAYYNASLEPKAASVAADYDPLADVIRQAHAAGLEVHAWLAVYEVAHTSYTLTSNHVAKAHPEWLTRTRDGKTDLPGGRIFVDPGLPAVQDHIVAVVRDILTHYDVDGIHLEDPGYPSESGYNAGSVELFNQETGKSGNPEDTDEAWRQWRSSQVTKLIAKIHDAVQEIKPKVRLSANVASHRPADTVKRSLQEWDVWASRKLVDFLVPMLSAAGSVMPRLASEASASAAGRHIYMGIGTYKLTKSRAVEEISAVRGSGTQGVVLFSYHYLQLKPDETDRAKMADLASVFAEPATVPAMTWKQEEEK